MFSVSSTYHKRQASSDSESDLDSHKHCDGVKLQVMQENSHRDEGRRRVREVERKVSKMLRYRREESGKKKEGE